MLLNEATRMCEEFKHEHLDVKDAYSVPVKKELFVIKEGSPVSAFKYTNFTHTEFLIKTALGTLPHNEQLENFRIC